MPHVRSALNSRAETTKRALYKDRCAVRVVAQTMEQPKSRNAAKKNFTETAGKSDKISFGRLIQLLQYLIYGLIAVAIIKWFIGQPK